MTLDFSASSFPPDLISGFAAEAQNPPAGKPSLWCQLCLRPAAHEPRLIIGPAPPFHPRTSPQPPQSKNYYILGPLHLLLRSARLCMITRWTLLPITVYHRDAQRLNSRPPLPRHYTIYRIYLAFINTRKDSFPISFAYCLFYCRSNKPSDHRLSPSHYY
jgi:hypothetical protein